MSTQSVFDQAVREASERWAEQKDNLVFACLVYHKIDSPLDIVLCEQRTLTETRVWAEPMTTKLRDDRIAAQNEELRALHAEVARLDSELARLTMALSKIGAKQEDNRELALKVLGGMKATLVR